MANKLPVYVYAVVLVLVDNRDREAILGDFTERYYAKKCNEGEKAATRWLRRNLATSMMPFLLVRLYKLIQVLAVLLKALDLIQKRD